MTPRSLLLGLPALPSLALASTPVGWHVLQEEQVVVACERGAGSRWCEACAVLAAPPEAVESVVADIGRYPEIFRTVQRAELVEEGLVEVVIDLPGPLPRRTVRATWAREEHGDTVTWRFGPPPDAPDVRTEGLLSVTPDAQGGALLVYRWHPLAGLPSLLAEPLARVHGHNVVWGLALALDTAPTAPASP